MRSFLLLVLFIVGPSTTKSNPALAAWNNVLQDQIRANKIDTNTAARYGALLHTAQWEALQDITAQIPAATPEAQAAAVASAGKTVLLSLLPASADKVNALYEQQVPAAAPATDRSATLSTNLLNERTNDGSSPAPPPYKGVEEVGKWRPTPPDFKAGLTPQWGHVKPFNMKQGDQFRVPSPPALDSEAFKKSYLEVKEVGSKNSTVRTPEQTEIANWWSGNVELLWYDVLKQVTANLSLADSAKAYAATASAMADARIAAFDSKYFYNSWRPITSIPVGNNQTTGFPADPAFESVFKTPPHPEYPQGHTTTGEAAATILRAVAGKDDVPFVLTSEKVPGKTRTYSSLRAASLENLESRVLGGVHFRFSGDVSLPLGEKVGEAAVAAYKYTPGAAPVVAAAGTKTRAGKRRSGLRRE